MSVDERVDQRLENIEAMLIVLVERQKVKEYYTVEEFAAARRARMLHRARMVPPGQNQCGQKAIRPGEVPALGHPPCRGAAV